MKKGDIITAIDPCVMNHTKEKALNVGEKYEVLRIFVCPIDKVQTFEIKSNIGMHTFEVKEVEDFFIVPDNESALLKRNEELEAMLENIISVCDVLKLHTVKNEITELLNKPK